MKMAVPSTLPILAGIASWRIIPRNGGNFAISSTGWPEREWGEEHHVWKQLLLHPSANDYLDIVFGSTHLLFSDGILSFHPIFHGIIQSTQNGFSIATQAAVDGRIRSNYEIALFFLNASGSEILWWIINKWNRQDRMNQPGTLRTLQRIEKKRRQIPELVNIFWQL